MHDYGFTWAPWLKTLTLAAGGVQLDASKAAEAMAAEELGAAAAALGLAQQEAAARASAAADAQAAAEGQAQQLAEKSSRLAHLEGAPPAGLILLQHSLSRV